MKKRKNGAYGEEGRFFARLRDVKRSFRAALRNDTETVILSEHTEQLRDAVCEGAKAVMSAEELIFIDGEPRLFTFARAYLQKTKGEIHEKTLRTELYEWEIGGFGDTELSLLQAFFILVSAELWLSEKEEGYLRAILRLSDVDFTAIFFAFSKTERIFLSEAAGVYADCDTETRYLYHKRLLKLAEETGTEADAAAKILVARANRERTHLGAVMPKEREGGILYFAFLLLMLVILLVLYAVMGWAGYVTLLTIPLALIPLYEFAKLWLNPFFTGAGESRLPRLAQGKELAQTKVLVSIATFLYGEEKDRVIFDKLEDFYLTEGTENVAFAVLGDLPQNKKRTAENDAETFSYAQARISALREKYGAHFYLFIRERRYSHSESAYIGWERKRGGVLELCRHLRGKQTSIRSFFDDDFLPDVRYLITLDADTNLYIGAVKDLLGTILHPENKPYFDSKKGCVTRGHAIIQPRMIPSLLSASGTAFAKLTSGTAGLDPYARAGFDLYQSLFDEGIYCGKGILDIDIFLSACDGFFPKERILSHDLAEGNLLRAALATDIVLSDGSPKNALSYYMRGHRWLRGDLQILPYLRRFVKNSEGERIENPMSPLSKYKILDNLLRAMMPFVTLIWLTVGFLIGGTTEKLTVFFVLFPILWRAWETVFYGICHRGFTAFGDALGTVFFRLCTMAYEGYLFADAAVRTLYRFFVSRKNFLNWTTAFEGDRLSARSPDAYYRRFLPSVLIGAFFFCLPSRMANFFGILWVFFPLFAFLLSREKRKISHADAYEKRKLLGYVRDTWLFFRDFVNENTHGLPPDNVQFSPTHTVAMRTSPTNIGMYLLSLLAARDLGFVGRDEFFQRSQSTTQTLKKLRKWNGHLYNWYDLHTLSVLGDAFISSVDSGNLTASLITFCEGAKEYANETPKLLSVIDTLTEIIKETDFRALYDEKRQLFRVGYSVSSGTYTDSHYDVFMSEARTTSFIATALRQVPLSHYFRPSRRVVGRFGFYGIASWSGTAFEYFMPTIFLPHAEGSLSSFALAYAYRQQKHAAVRRRYAGRQYSFFGISECGYFAFDSALNYQYRAFGVASLALDPLMRTGKIIAPYASFLMLEQAPEEILSNLEILETFGAYGKYGFYEALDAESTRVGGGFAVLKSVMAHHAGMSILSAANLLLNGIMRKRFLREVHMRAVRELLYERIPNTVSPLPKKRVAAMLSGTPIVPPSVPEETLMPKSLIDPETVMLSNNKTKIFLSSSGHMELLDGREAIFISDFSRFSLGNGAKIYVNIDGTVFPTVPLGEMADGFISDFSFFHRSDMAEYRSRHRSDGKNYEIRLMISVFPDKEFVEISCAVSGDYKSFFAVLYFEPILTERKNYLAHKSFSDLFLESTFFADEEILTFRRRSRNDHKEPRCFGVAVSAENNTFETMRDRCLTGYPDEKAYADLAASDRIWQNSEGALILPVCAVRSGVVGFGKRLSFFLGETTDTDELLYLLTKCREHGERKKRKRKTGALLHLQYASAGLTSPADAFERFLLSRIIFGTQEGTIPKGYALSASDFWRQGISGENPIVLARLQKERGEVYERLTELLRLFKYLCIRGLRYDLVILYRETDGYFRFVRGRITEYIRRAGCENFISFACGIYPLDENTLSNDEIHAFALSAAADFDLQEPISEQMAAYSGLSFSAEMETLLKKEAAVRISPIPMPRIRGRMETISGYFHEKGFLVKKGHEGAPFSHVLASANFGTVLTENSLGFTFARNAGMQKLTPHTADGFYEDHGERLLLRIYDRTDDTVFHDHDLCASAAWADFRFDRVLYHGRIACIDYTVTVSLMGRHDAKKITISLETDGKGMQIALFFAVKPCLSAMAKEARFYRFQKMPTGVRIRSLAEREKRNFRMAILSPETNIIYTETAAFRTNGALFDGNDDAVFIGAKKKLIGNIQISFTLLSYFSEKQYAYLERLALSGQDMLYDISAFLEPIAVKSGHPFFDAIVNRWSLYQVLVARIFARSGFYQVSGAYGFRDQLQDALALIPVFPQMTKILILRAAAHQYEDGSVQHWWHGTEKTGIRTRCSDDFLWLPYVTAEYIEKTGDTDILDLSIPYLSSPPLAPHEHERYEHAEKSTLHEPLLSHLLRAVAYGRKYGPHGLLLIGTCDWNDGMSAVGIKGRGESVWLVFFRILVLRRMRMLVADEKILSEMQTEENLLYEALRTHGFDGKWYRRGYYDDGSVLGGAEREDCKIDLLPQAFAAILAHESSFETEKAKMAMDAVWKMLYDREHSLVRLLYPPFDKDTQSPGYIKGYVPGIRENGGQYTHAAVWAALGFLLCGENAKGAEILFAINPAERYRNDEIAKAYRIEPYVFAGDVYANPQHMGRGGWSYYTGSAAWYRKTALEFLCGYTETKDGFYLCPRLSERFSSFTLTVAKKKTRYQIEVSLADAPSLMLDGEYIAEKERYFFRFDGGEHRGFLKIQKTSG
ncbi:MAG: DUF3131 domain-containing protein [Clostridia bacterium]|nr:DUF3131 domain-containing protein [Clostridia bacterium]